MVYDVTLKGWNPDGSQDHLVKWVWCNNIVDVVVWLTRFGLTHVVESITELGERSKRYTFADGVDVLLDNHGDTEYIPGKWHTTVEPFSPQDWINESLSAMESNNAQAS